MFIDVLRRLCDFDANQNTIDLFSQSYYEMVSYQMSVIGRVLYEVYIMSIF